ncbi:DMT family transporter [Salipiger sp. 1_MG-2023]|uniref:DMT family transporter n=1 Tax=Salipiger sp. 1_MG-2023 TaxID=3062665 RepID=UPI0026E3F596|nr:DMT family transporter [Salipiger sp. 1_MG-2023]MDO6585493.1 DMT family transporter [Salipiger sp. 1_MG-2023]
MPQTSSRGILLAAFGALALTPDALLMRLSGMDGLQMLGWRGLCTGLVFWAAWLLTTQDRSSLRRLASPAGLVLVLAHFSNALLFPLGIALAPVAIVLIAVACMPVSAALLSRLVLGEPTSRATWRTIAAVLTGIAIAVTGSDGMTLNDDALIGAACGLGVAMSLATTFVTLRRTPELPLLPGLGTGALLAGLAGLYVTGPARMTDGNVSAIVLTGLVILPVSFFALSSASRHTQAANVSLMMLLETVLGPIWVWAFLDETPTARTLAGAALVLSALAIYLARPLVSSGVKYPGGSRRRGAAPPSAP